MTRLIGTRAKRRNLDSKIESQSVAAQMLLEKELVILLNAKFHEAMCEGVVERCCLRSSARPPLWSFGGYESLLLLEGSCRIGWLKHLTKMYVKGRIQIGAL